MLGRLVEQGFTVSIISLSFFFNALKLSVKVFFRGSPGGWAQCILLILFVKLMFLLRKPVSSTPMILGPFLRSEDTVSGNFLLLKKKKNHQDFRGAARRSTGI